MELVESQDQTPLIEDRNPERGDKSLIFIKTYPPSCLGSRKVMPTALVSMGYRGF
jgi:hypothetical protein